MKKKINLLTLSRNELKKVKGSQEICFIFGITGGDDPPPSGEECFCGCYYSGEPGGSSSEDNDAANDEGGLQSPPRE